MGGNSRQSFTFPVSGMLGGGIQLQVSVRIGSCVRLIPVGNNRNDHFRYTLFRCRRPLNTGVRLIKVSFTENEGNKFGDFGYCPLNRGCPVNTVSA